MEIEEGDFVRTDEGYISKETDRNFIKMLLEGKSSFGKPVKHSKQLIDLIEAGDYVNGERVVEVIKGREDEDTYILHVEALNTYKFVTKKEIKTILTHEQFEKNCYRLEE